MKDARNVISIKWGENTEYFSTQSIILDCSRCYIKQLLMGVHYQLDVFQQVIWLLVGSHTLFMRTRDPFFFSNNPCVHFWLQFQLTVNISAVTTALEGSFAYAKSPLAAIQLLWVNLLMDALESLALASEPPTDELLKRDPINRSRSIITIECGV